MGMGGKTGQAPSGADGAFNSGAAPYQFSPGTPPTSGKGGALKNLEGVGQHQPMTPLPPMGGQDQGVQMLLKLMSQHHGG